MKKLFAATLAAPVLMAAVMTVSASPASAQVTCRMARDYQGCLRRLQEIYREEARAYDQIDRDLARVQRFYQGFDTGMKAGTWGVQRATRGRVPAYDAYRGGRTIGNWGYRLWNR